MRNVLAIEPGALTPLAVINDDPNAVSVVIDAGLMSAEQLNFHPMVQAESIGLRPEELVRFLESCGRGPILLTFETEDGAPG